MGASADTAGNVPAPNYPTPRLRRASRQARSRSSRWRRKRRGRRRGRRPWRRTTVLIKACDRLLSLRLRWGPVKRRHFTNILQSEEIPMLKSVAMSSLAIALGLAAWLLPIRGEQATAQSGALHILVVEYDIIPAEIDKYLTAIKELGAAAVKEPGCRQLSIAVSQKDAN